jgi:hypothetical protein
VDTIGDGGEGELGSELRARTSRLTQGLSLIFPKDSVGVDQIAARIFDVRSQLG